MSILFAIAETVAGNSDSTKRIDRASGILIVAAVIPWTVVAVRRALSARSVFYVQLQDIINHGVRSLCFLKLADQIEVGRAANLLGPTRNGYPGCVCVCNRRLARLKNMDIFLV